MNKGKKNLIIIYLKISNLEKEILFKTSKSNTTLYERIDVSGARHYFYDFIFPGEIEIKNEVNFTFQAKGKKFQMWLHSEFLREVDILSIKREMGGEAPPKVDEKYEIKEKSKNIVSFLDVRQNNDLTQSGEINALYAQEGHIENICSNAEQKRFANERYKSEDVEIIRQKAKKDHPEIEEVKGESDDYEILKYKGEKDVPQKENKDEVLFLLF